MNGVKVYKSYTIGTDTVYGYVENDRFYSNDPYWSSSLGYCRYGNVYKNGSGECLGSYDSKYFYLGSSAVAYIENGKIYDCYYPNNCIGEYDGFAYDASCIALLFCDFSSDEVTVRNTENERSGYIRQSDGGGSGSYTSTGTFEFILIILLFPFLIIFSFLFLVFCLGFFLNAHWVIKLAIIGFIFYIMNSY